MTTQRAARLELDERVTTAQLSDSLDVLGVRGFVLSGDITPLNRGHRIAGSARTILFEPVTEAVEVAYAQPDPYREFIEFMDAVEAGDVIVVATGGDRRTAYWGELFCAAARGRGAVGVVCDGYTRDTAKIEPLDFPVFSIGTRPIDYRARMRVATRQEPVVCGGVPVAPGDLVLADDDGVVVVPAASATDAVALANERASTESTVLDDLLSGRTIGEVWNRYRVL